ncbi:type 1 glutamine amidotransferase [Saccharothrix saharensis]|uniref:Type 1 glutamine amidotransferase n=1 Tax=Saccharothrix saharensis TaxID=571190 RepID=A0A543J8Z7_9PSEU|nr:type 1 glutamine amidotransferase [Saccharothrix saharensis]
MTRLRTALGAITAAAVMVLAAAPVPAPAADPSYKVLVFSKTAGFRHSSIPNGVQAIRDLGAANNFTVTATEDAAAFTGANLAQFRAVVFLSTTGDVLNDTQQAAFESYVRAGGGFVGVHAASDTEYAWPFYGALVGGYFHSHPAIQQATIRVEDRAHASTAHLGADWARTDEWYNFQANPRPNVHVLARLDEGTYSGGNMGDHPIAWCQTYQGGRSWYTAGGHTEQTFAEPGFRAHLLGGIRYAAGMTDADCRAETGYSPLFNGSNTTGWSQAGPGGFTVADGTLTSQGGMGLLWYSAKEFRSYSLKLDWKLAGDDNSGVFIGFPPSSDPWTAVNNGYEIQIDATDTPDRTTGSVYGYRSADIAARDAALNPPGEWNTFELLVQGERLQVFLNGTKVNDFTNTDPNRSLVQGHIGLQNHGTGDDASFRNIRVKELTTGTRTGRITGIGGKCVDVSNSGTADGTRIQLWTCNSTAAQQWTVPGDGTLRALGKCLDVQGGGTANGTVTQLWTCNGTGAQQWVAQADGTLRNPQSGRCLDAAGVSSADGTVLHIWDCLAAVNQKWVLP